MQKFLRLVNRFLGRLFHRLLRALNYGPLTTQPHLPTPAQDRSHLAPSTVPVPRLFALVIGIDAYPNRGLSGAAADAEAMRAYLKDDLQVPRDHICFLVDHQATRGGIVKAFKCFKKDQRIKSGDPIVIFFAGHGGELPAPPAWGVDKTQCIIPYDYETAGPIPDHTIGVLIDNIAEEKGDNITVILDCCYSAGGARDVDKDYVARTFEFDFLIPANVDQDILGSQRNFSPDGFAHQGHRSHVLLAACGVNEVAREDINLKRGLFTSALLKVLKSGAIHNRSYAQIIGDISIDKQHPQCLGTNQHRILFDHSVPHGGLVRYSAQVNDQDTLIISAGLAHGVSHGVEFSLYNNHEQGLRIAVVDGIATIGDFQTTITPSPAQPAGDFYAKLTRVGRVPLCLAPTTAICHPNLKEALRKLDSNAPDFKLVEATGAKLQVVMNDDLVVINNLDPLVNRLGLTQLPYTVPLERLHHVLRSAAHFYWYLDLTNRKGPGEPEVVVNLHLLEKYSGQDKYGRSSLVPVEPGLLQKDPNSPDNPYLVELVASPEDRYGIRVTNNTPRDLYLNAFLFNNSSFSIMPCYTQPSGRNLEPPLKQNGMFAIGEGTGETTPLSFTLRDGQDIDVGYLKVFFATRPIDLSDIAQISPFPEKKSRSPIKSLGGARDGGPAEESPTRKDLVRDIWFAVTIPVVQQRKV